MRQETGYGSGGDASIQLQCTVLAIRYGLSLLHFLQAGASPGLCGRLGRRTFKDLSVGAWHCT